MTKFGFIQLYCGGSGKIGFYNNQVLGLAKAMKKRNYDCYIFSPDTQTDSITEEKVEDNITIIHTPAKAWGVHGRYPLQILSEYGIQFAQLESDTQMYVPIVLKYCKKNHIPVYNYIGTLESDTHNPIKKAIMGMLCFRNILSYRRSICFAKTEEVKNRMLAKKIKDVIVAPVGLDFSIIPQVQENQQEIRKKLRIPEQSKVLLFVGRLEEYKRPFEMLTVMKKLGEGYYGIMIGQGKLSDEVKSRIETMGLMDRIDVIDRIPNTEIHKYYVASDYLLNFNEQEIFGMTILEAMYQGTSVIAVKAPGPENIIENQKTGFLVTHSDKMIDEMVELIQKDKKLQPELIREEIKKRFSWDVMAGIVDEWIDNIAHVR